MAPCGPPTRPARLRRTPTPHRYLNPDRSGRGSRRASSSIRYAGAAAAAVLDGHGGVEVLLNGEWFASIELDGPRLYEIVDTNHHERHELTLVVRRARDGLRVQLQSPAPPELRVQRHSIRPWPASLGEQNVIERTARPTPHRGQDAHLTRLEGSRSVSGNSRPDSRDGRRGQPSRARVDVVGVRATSTSACWTTTPDGGRQPRRLGPDPRRLRHLQDRRGGGARHRTLLEQMGADYEQELEELAERDRMSRVPDGRPRPLLRPRRPLHHVRRRGSGDAGGEGRRERGLALCEDDDGARATVEIALVDAARPATRCSCTPAPRSPGLEAGA